MTPRSRRRTFTPNQTCKYEGFAARLDSIEIRKTLSDSSVHALRSSKQIGKKEKTECNIKHSLVPLAIQNLRGNLDINNIPKDIGVVLPKGLSPKKLKFISVNEMDSERSARLEGNVYDA